METKPPMSAPLLLLLILFHVGFTSSASQKPDPLESKLRASVKNYKLSDENFVNALTTVAAQFRLPMGIEWVRDPAALQKVDLSWRGATVHQVIESLVKSQPGYDLEIRNGLIHVFPRTSRADPQNFLNHRVSKFTVHDDFVRFASRKLHNTANQVVAPSKPTSGAGEAGSMATGQGDQRVTLELDNVTYRDILDALSSAVELKVWIVTFGEAPSVTPTGFRRTVSPRDGSAVPDSQQPAWELLTWGQKPY